MRVLFTPYPSVAHLLPMAPLAWAFQSAGHEVRVASQHTIAGDIMAAGLSPVPLGDPRAHEARNRADALAPTDHAEVLRFGEVLGLNAEEMEHWIEFYQYLLLGIADYARPEVPEAADLVEFARVWRPDLVVWDQWFGCAAVAARACGAAHARMLVGADCVAWSLDRLGERREAVRAAGLPENPLADAMRPLAQRHGVQVDRELLLGQWSIDPMPAAYGPPTGVTPIQMRHVTYGGADVFPQWLHRRPERPRVALSLGESIRRFIPGDWDRAPRIMEAVAGLDIEVVATLNDLQLQGVPHIPDNVRVIEWVPLTHLLPTCSAIIHHGGPGTFAAAVAHGVPQLVCDTEESILIRRENDQPTTATSTDTDTGTYQLGREFGVREETEAPRFVIPAKNIEASLAAAYVTQHGAGMLLNHRTQTIEEIGKKVLHVVNNPDYRRGANTIYEAFLATPSPATIVHTLETLAARRRP